jgi:outer membrane protein OmpA-like peptidoglycan-associated protein
MNKLFILVGFTLNFSLLFAQECNKNVFSEEEAVKLSAYGKNLEKSILEKNPGDTALIAKLQGDYSSDLCGYTDESVIKISNYLKELEKLDSINKIVKEEVKPIEATIIEEEPIKQNETKPTTLIASSVKTVETLLFAPNSAQIKPSKFAVLVSQLKSDEKAFVIIDGYADADASDEYNLKLSQRRANAVKSYLISKGIKASRITINAYGEKNPVADNETPEGKAKNRRVVISVK